MRNLALFFVLLVPCAVLAQEAPDGGAVDQAPPGLDASAPSPATRILTPTMEWTTVGCDRKSRIDLAQESIDSIEQTLQVVRGNLVKLANNPHPDPWGIKPEQLRQRIAQLEAAAAKAHAEQQELIKDRDDCLEWTRIRAEKQRAQKAKEQQASIDKLHAATAAMDAKRQDPRSWQLLYSAQICWYQKDRVRALTNISKEHKYARIGGVVNMSDLHQWQDNLRRDDEGLIVVRQKLSGRTRLAPLPCSDKEVARYAEYCFDWILGGEPVKDPDFCDNLVSEPRQ